MPSTKLILTGCTQEEFNGLSFTKCHGNATRLVKVDHKEGFIAIRLGEECSIGSIEGLNFYEALRLFKDLLGMPISELAVGE